MMTKKIVIILIIVLSIIHAYSQCPIDAGNGGAICIGQTIQLQASGATNYNWYPAGGLSATNIANPIANPTTTTTYYCSGICGGVDLIVNGDFTQGNTGFSSDYSLCTTPGSCDAFMYIVAANASAHHSSWTCTDHTSGSGNFMIVDGATASNKKVWGQTVTVVPNTNYTFSCWVSSMSGWSPPADLHFFFNGTSIGNIVASTSSACTWAQFTANWNSGSNTSVIIRIVDNCIDYANNDFGIDNISLIAPISTALDSVKVTVKPLPIADAGNNQTVCAGTSVTLAATGGTSYQWNNGVTNGVPFLPTATTTYTVTVTNANGCTATDNVQVTVNSLLIAEAGNNQTICAGTSITLTATGGTSYQWNNGVTNGVPFVPTATTTYTVTVTSNDCSATDNVMITVNPLPNAQITSFTDASCGMNDGSAIASGGIGYLWSNGQTTASITGLAPNNYTVTVTDINGCTADTNVTIGQISAPSATASSTNENCNQSNGTTTVVASGGTGNYAYTWSTNPQQTSATATGLPAGTYTVTVTDGNCSATTSTIVLPISGPTASFTAFPVPVDINETISFLDNSSGNIVSWQWNLDDGSQATGTSFNHQYTTTGNYTVTLVVTDNNTCTDSYSDTIIVKNHFTLFIPNAFSPDGDGLNDSFLPIGEGIDPNNYDMKIFDRWGNLLFHTTDMNEPWKGTLNNDETANRVIGVYVYRILLKEINGSENEFIGSVTLFK